MKRLFTSCAVALSLVALAAGQAQAEVKTREKSQVKLEGMLGRMAGMFGGKAVKEGIVSTTAVKGTRKATMNDLHGQIVDLAEEKVYELDMQKKTYEVMTFEDIRRKMREAQEKLKESQKEQQAKAEEKKPTGQEKEVDVDFDVKETGQKKSIAGYDAREVIMTVTVREKGKTLEESGGLVVTSDMWLGPDIPALKEVAEFQMKYARAIAPDISEISAEQMAAIVATYPMVKQGMDRLAKEKTKLSGYPLATTTTFDGVKSPDQTTQEKQNSSGGGLSGMLARKMMKKNNGNNGDSTRATIFTATSEVLEVSTTVPAGDLEIPAGFKQKS
jgi:hypothetical protein